MSKSLKKILVASASLLMLISIDAGISNVNINASHHYISKSVKSYWIHSQTGKLYHGIRLGGHYYPAGTKLYNGNLGTGKYVASMYASPYAPRFAIPSWAMKKGHKRARKHYRRNYKISHHSHSHRHARRY